MKQVHKLLAGLLCALLLTGCLTACGSQESGRVTADVSQTAGDTAGTEAAESKKTVNTEFTLRYTSEESFNPMTCSDANNELVLSLITEPLFSLDSSFYPVPVLAESCTTEDGLTYTVTLKEAAFHDGSRLTAGDVVYSLDMARTDTKYGNRLACIDACYGDGEGNVIIELNEENRNLAVLLDVPIIAYGTCYEDIPVGTGPYKMKKLGSSLRLEPFENYRNPDAVYDIVIYLKEFEDDTVEDSFSTKALDLIWDNPNDDSILNLYGEYESRFYDTSILQYIGFNFDSLAMCDLNLRRAISCAVDRGLITDTIYEGFGREANLLYNPSYYLYKDSWGKAESYSISAMSAYLADSGLRDTDSDGYLEYQYGGWWEPLTIRFLVCSDSSKKVAAAQTIADSLARVGLDVEIKALPWKDYLEALEYGSYEIYYGEVSLTRDFDFSQLLLPEGSLSYGGTGGGEYYELLAAIKQADNEVSLRVAAGALCNYAAEQLPLIPVMYRQYVVYSHRGELTGLQPTVSGIFREAGQWTITLN